MSSYPNMSYCMCENTLAALNQVLEAMRTEGKDFFKEMSNTERSAFEELFHACEDFINASDDIMQEIENEE